MNHLNLLLNLLIIWAIHANASDIVCYYDATSINKEGKIEQSLKDLAIALPSCDYLVYGYVGIDPKTFQLQTLDTDLDINRDHFQNFIKLKEEMNPDMLVLLSVGGDKDVDDIAMINKYLEVLENSTHREAFVNYSKEMLQKFDFDGLDLAWQFPKNPPRINSFWKRLWKSIKCIFGKPVLVDAKAALHKQQFTALTGELKQAFEKEKLILTLTVLPNVNAALFIDIRSVIKNVKFVNLAAFDFQTPERYPKEADHPAPLYALEGRSREDNAEHQVSYWLGNGAPSHKINLGIPAFGRSWKSSFRQYSFKLPNIEVEGPASRGLHTKVPGILSQSEICQKIYKNNGHKNAGAFYDKTEYFWVGYEDIRTIGEKMEYVQKHDLRGVALFDLSMDDIKGKCNGERFSLLNRIKKMLSIELQIKLLSTKALA